MLGFPVERRHDFFAFSHEELVHVPQWRVLVFWEEAWIAFVSSLWCWLSSTSCGLRWEQQWVQPRQLFWQSLKLKIMSLLAFGAVKRVAGLKGQQEDSGLPSGMFKMGSLWVRVCRGFRELNCNPMWLLCKDRKCQISMLASQPTPRLSLLMIQSYNLLIC